MAKDVDYWCGRLDSVGPYERREACRELGSIGDRQAVEPLIGRLGDSDERVRSAACTALGQLRDRRALEPLVQALKSEDDASAALSACSALCELGEAEWADPLRRLIESTRALPHDALSQVGTPSRAASLVMAISVSTVPCVLAGILCGLTYLVASAVGNHEVADGHPSDGVAILVIVWEFSLLTSALVFFCLRWIGRRKLAAMLPVADEVAEVVCRGNAYVMPILQSWFKRTGAKWDRPAIETLTKVHQRLKAVARAILCRVHLTRFETRPHEAHPDKVPVFCCRLCGEPANMMLGVRELICVVDTRQSVRLPEGAAPENGVLRAYWVRTEPLFDFDVVEVVHTDDFEAERFCIQVGNDTDPFRARRYRKTTCRIAADCPLSENTWRILRATFGKVEPAPSPGGNA